MPKTWQRNKDVDDGLDIVDPPIIQSYERQIQDAAAAADHDLLAYHYAAYNDERQRVVDAIESMDDPTDPASLTAGRASGVSSLLRERNVDVTQPPPTQADAPADEDNAPEGALTGAALDARAAELDIQGRGGMTPDEKRAAIAEREAQGEPQAQQQAGIPSTINTGDTP